MRVKYIVVSGRGKRFLCTLNKEDAETWAENANRLGFKSLGWKGDNFHVIPEPVEPTDKEEYYDWRY